MKLFSRNDCPLCEDAEEVLIKRGVDFTFVDIDLDEKLKEKYHVHVPVLMNDKGEEIFWPFDEVKLKEFL